MIDPVDRTVRAIARRNSYALVWAQFGIAHVVMLGGLGLLELYQQMSVSAFWLLDAGEDEPGVASGDRAAPVAG